MKHLSKLTKRQDLEVVKILIEIQKRMVEKQNKRLSEKRIADKR